MQTWPMLHFALILFIVTHAIDAALQTAYLDELCGETVDLELVQERSLLLKLNATHVFSSTRAYTWKCPVTLTAPPLSQLMIAVRGLNLPQCNTSFDVYGRSLNINDVLAFNNCTSSVNNTVVTPGNTGILVVSSDGWHNDDVTVLVTSFYTATGTCQPSDFLCSNKRCVSGKLQCNGYDNCGDGSDCKHIPGHEIDVDTTSAFPSSATIFLPIFFCSCFGSMAYVKYRAYKRRHAVIRRQQGMVGTSHVIERGPALQIPPQTVHPNYVGGEYHRPSHPMPVRQFSNTVPPGTPAQPNYIIPGPISMPQPQSINQFPSQTHYASPQINQGPPLSYTNMYSQEPSAPPPPYEETPGQTPFAPPPPYEEKPMTQQSKLTNK